MNKISYIVAAGALALLTACGSSGDSNGDSMASHEGTATNSAPAATMDSMRPSASATFNGADTMFAQMMIPHHQQAVEMADMAATAAGDAEVKELATKIKAAQGPEIQTMKGWLTSWGQPVPEGGMGHDMPGLMSEADMKKLEAAKGKAFDKLFAEQMIAHHKGAIEMAKTEQANGSNPEAKELAKAIEAAQQAEVEQLQKIVDRL